MALGTAFVVIFVLWMMVVSPGFRTVALVVGGLLFVAVVSIASRHP
jgi:hypothetical protein